MPNHKVYFSILEAVNKGRLKEPFSNDDFERECSGFAKGTYPVFLHKHRIGNPGGNSELFELVAKGKFKLIRPYKYQ
jgi:hypothetical protein